MKLEHLKAYYGAQAGWTRATRTYLYRRTGLLRARKVLEVGCGAGDITEELMRRTRAKVTAVDIEPEAARCSARRCPGAEVINADASSLDMPDETFDAAVCHFALMWCADPAAVVAEMARVVKRSGYVIAMSEPDYGGLLEYPDSIRCGHLIAQGLRKQGADPQIGRKIRSLFRAAALETEVGLASAVWDAGTLKRNLEAHHWLIREAAGEQELKKIQAAHEAALKEDSVVFFLPVFWVCGLRK